MDINLNGKKIQVDSGVTLIGLIESKGLEADKIVIEYNYEIVKKEKWGDTKLKENDNIEVLRFVGGG